MQTVTASYTNYVNACRTLRVHAKSYNEWWRMLIHSDRVLTAIDKQLDEMDKELEGQIGEARTQSIGERFTRYLHGR